MNFTERLDRLFESTDCHVHIDRGEGSAEIQCRDDGGFLLTRLVVQNFEVPEADVFVGNGDALHIYRSFSRQEDFWQYAHNLKRDIETLAQVAAGCRVVIYRTIFRAKKKVLILPRGQSLRALGRLSKKPPFATKISSEPLK